MSHAPEIEHAIALPARRATLRLGAAMASSFLPGDVVFLEGELGAGKTFLVRAIARGLGVPSALPIQSPTFALVHEHPIASGALQKLVHADLYRLGESAELSELGLGEHEAAVLCIEWGERFRDALEPASGSLLVSLGGPVRTAHITGRGARGVALSARIANVLATPSGAR
jgi:tRNA threonylcarbamoyl adenosine modification protein YjeE